MPKTGYFFDSIIRQEEIDEDNLCVEDNLEEFSPMSAAEEAYWREIHRGCDPIDMRPASRPRYLFKRHLAHQFSRFLRHSFRLGLQASDFLLQFLQRGCNGIVFD